MLIYLQSLEAKLSEVDEEAKLTCLLLEAVNLVVESITPSSVPSEEREKTETMNHRTGTRITT